MGYPPSGNPPIGYPSGQGTPGQVQWVEGGTRGGVPPRRVPRPAHGGVPEVGPPRLNLAGVPPPQVWTD